MRRNADRARRLEHARALVLAYLAGHSRGEIAEMLELSRSAVTRLAKRCGVRLPAWNAPRTVGAKVHQTELVKLDLLARSAGVTRDEMATRLIRAALDASPTRLLGRDALPRRCYRRPKEAIRVAA